MKQETKNTTENINENVNAIVTRDNADKAITAGVNLLFDVTKVQTLRDVDVVLKGFETLTGMVSLPICKLFERVKSSRMYAGDYKTFEQWAAKRGVKKSTAYAYAKVGAFLDESGLHSKLFHTDEKDYTFSQLVIIAEKIDFETAVEWAKTFRLTPNMTVLDLKRMFNPKRITADKTDDNADEKTEKAEKTEKTEKAEKAEKTIEKPLTKTQKACQAIFNRYILSEYAEQLFIVLADFDSKIVAIENAKN